MIWLQNDYMQTPPQRRIALVLLVCLSTLVTGAGGQSARATLTIYKDGKALIRQPVFWDVKAGISTISHAVFPATLIEDSPFLKMEETLVGYQRLDRNVFSGETFFRRQVGREVEVFSVDGESETGLLVEFNAQRVTIQTRSAVLLFPRNQITQIKAAGQAVNREQQPTLTWDIYSHVDKKVSGDLLYLSEGFGWEAIYRFILNQEGTQAEFIPEAFISNHSDLDFEDLELQLVEGDLHKVRRPPPGVQVRRSGMAAEVQALEAAAPGFSEEGLGDYHIYSLPRRISFRHNESLTVRLYETRTIGCRKTYVFENTERTQRQEPLVTEYRFENTEANNLGVPLPRGKLEVYQTDARGAIKFAGEDLLRQIPLGEPATIIAGRSFDVIGKRKVLDYDRQKKSEEAIIELQVVNTRPETVQVRLVEKIYGDWVIRQESSMYIKADANTIHFPVTVPAGETLRVTYTYRKEWK